MSDVHIKDTESKSSRIPYQKRFSLDMNWQLDLQQTETKEASQTPGAIHTQSRLYKEQHSPKMSATG